MDEIADFITAKILSLIQFGFNKLFFTLQDENLATAFGLKHEICLRMLKCGLLRRDTGRAISVKDMQKYFGGSVHVEMRKGGPKNKNHYRFVADINELFNGYALDGNQSLLWKAFIATVRGLGDTSFFMIFLAKL